MRAASLYNAASIDIKQESDCGYEVLASKRKRDRQRRSGEEKKKDSRGWRWRIRGAQRRQERCTSDYRKPTSFSSHSNAQNVDDVPKAKMRKTSVLQRLWHLWVAITQPRVQTLSSHSRQIDLSETDKAKGLCSRRVTPTGIIAGCCLSINLLRSVHRDGSRLRPWVLKHFSLNYKSCLILHALAEPGLERHYQAHFPSHIAKLLLGSRNMLEEDVVEKRSAMDIYVHAEKPDFQFLLGIRSAKLLFPQDHARCPLSAPGIHVGMWVCISISVSIST